MLSHFMGLTISFAAIFTLLATLRGLVERAFTPVVLWIAILRFAGAVIFLFIYLNHQGLYSFYPWLNHLYVPASWFLAPSMYWLAVCYIEPEREFTLSQWLPYGPGIALIVAYAAIALFLPDQFAHLPVRYFQTGQLHWLDSLMIAGLMYGLVMYGMIWHFIGHNLDFQKLKEQGALRVLIGIVVGGFLGTVFFLMAYLFRYMDGIYGGATALAVYTMWIWVFSARHPHLGEKYEKAIQHARSSRLEGVDLDQLKLRLEKLMEEKVFLDETLSVAELADYAGIKHYQLSEFLNRVMGTNFARYVNSHRVQEARRLLASDSEASILSIAYQCGFSSKANFNLAFKTETGLSPRDYLKSLKPDLDS
ncbi:MAG: hypothetical protein CMN77_10390 [Spirochaetaceae bacterium]|nr:hypothetical protein [Spirochaetaceae bacterium]|tara:strand:+ start:69708 stop:70799 length:1092 start_codon:yes stop_codon:yes gene_type:complete